MKTVFKCKAMIPSLAHHNIECVFEIFSESHNAAFVPRHHEDLPVAHVAYVEQAMISYAISGVP